MDVAAIASLATMMSENSTREAVSMAVLKKAMDIDAAGALALIEAIPDTQPAQYFPAHLGKNINTTA